MTIFLCMFVFYLFLTSVWDGDVEETGMPALRIPTSPFVCRCALKFCYHSLQLPGCLNGYFLGEACVNGLYVLAASGQFFFCKVLLECCLLLCPSRKSHTWAKRGALHQAGPAACAMKVHAAYTTLEMSWNGFCWLIWTGKNSLSSMDWRNLKEEFWQQLLVRRQLKLISYVLAIFLKRVEPK